MTLNIPGHAGSDVTWLSTETGNAPAADGAAGLAAASEEASALSTAAQHRADRRESSNLENMGMCDK